MQQWVSSEPTVTVQEEQVQVVNPTNEEETEDSNVPSVAIGVSIAGVILLVALVVFAAVVPHTLDASEMGECIIAVSAHNVLMFPSVQSKGQKETNWKYRPVLALTVPLLQI